MDDLAAVLAGLVINADFVIPVRVHVAFVAVAKRGVAQGNLAGARWLLHAWAFVEDWRAIVVGIVIAAVAVVVRWVRGRRWVRGWRASRVSFSLDLWVLWVFLSLWFLDSLWLLGVFWDYGIESDGVGGGDDDQGE